MEMGENSANELLMRMENKYAKLSKGQKIMCGKIMIRQCSSLPQDWEK